LRKSAIYVEAPSLALLAPGHRYRDFEYAMAEVRLGFVGLDARRLTDVAEEAPIGALASL
jgi:hypothetical protein